MSIAVQLAQGTARDFPFQVTNPDGTVPTGIFLSTDVLTASVWSGLERAPAPDPHGELDIGDQRAVPGLAPEHR